MKNPNCDKDKCEDSDGEVHILPIGGGAHLILCRACLEHEINFRAERNKKLSADCAFALPKWEELPVYKTS